MKKVAVVTSASGSGGSAVRITLRHFRARRRPYPERFAAYRVVRLCSQREIDAFFRSVARET